MQAKVRVMKPMLLWPVEKEIEWVDHDAVAAVKTT